MDTHAHIPTTPELLLEPAFPYGEDLLQFIWEQRLFEQHGLRTTDGREVEVLEAGHIQHDSGPDLVDARIRLDGQVWAGTVEVHVRSSEWNAHGHSSDPAYENVVLHVVYEHDTDVRTRSGHVLPTIELFPRISSESLALYRTLMRGRGFVPCAEMIGRVDPARIASWLDHLLLERLARKTVEAESLNRQLNGDTAGMVYHLLLRAFGLKVNADPFAMLARALPWRTLLKYRDDQLRTEALLFGQAGLLQVDLVDEYPRQLQEEHKVLARLHGLRPAPVAAWKFARMRPVNFPTVRIAQLAQLLMRCDLSTLLATDDVPALLDRMDVTASAYWTDHYRFDVPGSPRPKRLGTAGAAHLLINAIVPALFALGRLHGRRAYEARAVRLLEQLPAEQNQLLEHWAALGLRADTAARGQALIELRNSYCAGRRCLSCGIGNQLLRSSVK